MSTRIEDYGVTMNLIAEDERYPMLLIQADSAQSTIGYWVDTSTGELTRFCTCAANGVSECLCGAWSED